MSGRSSPSDSRTIEAIIGEGTMLDIVSDIDSCGGFCGRIDTSNCEACKKLTKKRCFYRLRCACGEKFDNKQKFKEHYSPKPRLLPKNQEILKKKEYKN